MSNSNSVTLEAGVAASKNDLGLIICKSCNHVIASLPTDGYKKFYVVCQSCAREATN
ncbi:GapA-binding peptide SR1P [Paenibacillus planticolens]|uniref:GapA-binding peptide SR1P n=1 Tax=Paenibacillus planticolens TaxID=2654976 RepID=A0ABX1ZYN1_9BACL|nr:GapA-binding peptide SR1P [Paenibacillus planticolens]NOV03979.1 GapA-binding peptide SR1P [Paenibacillus planticolens]